MIFTKDTPRNSKKNPFLMKTIIYMIFYKKSSLVKKLYLIKVTKILRNVFTRIILSLNILRPSNITGEADVGKKPEV